ncbi:uncharacterized protein LOC123540771 [Mercenaria mercenaria]|uniref:uncharacterized protein LOC123540771 n=1 Tax=Mercenaria mercenaria TaxID=6596 RepID=UPI00234F801D|nr:uncharacterized protein LOC123540771 [Mercenaria mercenaria]
MMRYMTLAVLFKTTVWRCAGSQSDCTKYMYGTDFLFAFPDIRHYNTSQLIYDPRLSMRIMANSFSKFDIIIPSTSSASKTPFQVTHNAAYGSEEVVFNSSFITEYQASGRTIPGRVIEISAVYPVSLLMVYDLYSYIITSPIIPTKSLSEKYLIPAYNTNDNEHSQAQILVVAVNDSTVVHIDKHRVISHRKLLNKYETFVYKSNSDLSGYSVSSNNPIAVFSSVTSGYSPNHNDMNAPLFMQVVPIGLNATHFIVPALADTSTVRYYKIRIYAELNTYVQIHSTTDTTKKVTVFADIFYEVTTESSSTLEIVSHGSIMVQQIALNSQRKALFMTNIPAISQFDTLYYTDYTHSDSAEMYNMTYIVVIRYDVASGLLVNDRALVHNPDEVASATPLGDYTVLTIPMSALTSRVVVSHLGYKVRFGLFIYGSSGTLAYSHSAGMQYKNWVAILSPAVRSWADRQKIQEHFVSTGNCRTRKITEIFEMFM